MKITHKKGLTLLEITITLVILSLTMAGLTATFISGRKWLMHSRLKMTGGELGREFLDPISRSVRQDEWDVATADYAATNDLHLTDPSTPRTGSDITLNNKTYHSAYTVSKIPTLADTKYEQARKVKVEITWDE